ncbi:MAG: hypothetical protein WD489_07625 [Rhodovibrionaceae bacterium]
MALEKIHLRKLLKILFLDPNRTRSAIRTDIREDIAREAGGNSSGGDFYAPFWADAKNHVFGVSDLHESVSQRIDSNYRRRDLYPKLRDGFLLWWNERRRWINEPMRPGQSAKAQFEFPRIAATVKVDNILSVRDGLNAERYVYPYFAPEPVLSENAARLGLWLLSSALPEVPAESLRILDVIRGQTFSLDRTPFQGGEEEDLRLRYVELLRQRDALREEYE